MDLWIIIGLWIFCGIASLLVARTRGLRNATSWLVLGTLLGPFGLILALMDARPPKHEYTMEALNRLGDLWAEGALSDAEYEASSSDGCETEGGSRARLPRRLAPSRSSEARLSWLTRSSIFWCGDAK